MPENSGILDEVLKANLMTGRPVTSTALRDRGLTRRELRKYVKKRRLLEVKMRNRITGVVMNGYIHPDYKGPAKAPEPEKRIVQPGNPDAVKKEVARYERRQRLIAGAR